MDFQRPQYNENGGGRIGAPFTSGGSGFQHHDLVVIVVMVAIAIVISLFLIVAMLFIRCPVCLFHDRSSSNYNNAQQNAVGFPQNHLVDPQNEAYLPEVFRDSHTITTMGGKDGSLASGEETMFYPTDRDKIIPSRGSVSGKNILTLGYDGTLQDGTLSQYPQNRQFFILAKHDGNYAISLEGTPIELSTLESVNRQNNQPQQQLNQPQQQNHQNQTGQHQQRGTMGQDMRTSQSASCLSGLSSDQHAASPNGYRSESDIEDELSSTKKRSWKLKKNAADIDRTARAKAATLGRAASPPRKRFLEENCCPRDSGGQETLHLLATTAPATPSGSKLAASKIGGKDRQQYTMLVNTAGSTPSKVTADQLRYVQIHNTPTHLGGKSRTVSGKKSTPSVSWQMEPHELHTYSPETSSEKLLTGTGTFVDIESGYARLGKNAEASTMPPYDQLVHRSRTAVPGSGSYSDFPSSVI